MHYRILTVCCVLAATTSLSSIARAAKPEKQPDKQAAAFAEMDKNGDGVVTQAEYVDAMKDKLGDDGAKAHFAELDKDHDGKLTKEEFGLKTAKKRGKKKAAN